MADDRGIQRAARALKSEGFGSYQQCREEVLRLLDEATIAYEENNGPAVVVVVGGRTFDIGPADEEG